ncbi:inactive N-acetylated-alpha-linked acidic dipeptidase-like protein 2 [Petromyzon marinus]|uniref:inactive N-acetylated-alpha-linked acidic dipeptidase-like protein 2 n=1 Tax=Petromyzon marinus TaxID=7757 RepID=UPI003F700B5E
MQESCRGWAGPETPVHSAVSTGDVAIFTDDVALATLKTRKLDLPESRLQLLDPNCSLHANITRLSVRAALRLVDDAVLPLRVIDPALDVQIMVDALQQRAPPCLPREAMSDAVSLARSLRETSARLQSAVNRPSNDPAERGVELRLRSLNDALRSVERAFLTSSSSSSSSSSSWSSSLSSCGADGGVVAGLAGNLPPLADEAELWLEWNFPAVGGRPALTWWWWWW